MPVQLTCETCGKPFRLSPSKRVGTRGRFCSRACSHVIKRRPFDPARFWSKVSKSADGCWEYQGTRTKHGYGRVSISGGTLKYAHRVAWELTNGPIPEGKMVRHGCDNPPCCRPDHLSLGDQRENNADRDSRGRTHRGERTGGAKLTEKQVLAIREVASLGMLSQRAIARAFEVPRQTIQDILARRTWDHIP